MTADNNDKAAALRTLFEPDRQLAPATMDRIEPRKFGRFSQPLKISLIGLIVFGSAACAIAWSAAPPSTIVAEKDVVVRTVKSSSFDDSFEVTGLLDSERIYSVTTDVSGKVSSVLVSTGDVVKAGQPLVVLENQESALELGRTRTAVANANAAIQDLHVRLERSRLEHQQTVLSLEGEIETLSKQLEDRRALAEEGFAPANTVTSFEANLRRKTQLLALERSSFENLDVLYKAQSRTANVVYQQAVEARDLAQTSMANLTITAPSDGQISGFEITQGQGLSFGQEIAQIRDISKPIARASVDEYYLTHLKRGQSADIRLSGQTLKARLSRIEPDVVDGQFRAEWQLEGLNPMNQSGVEFGQSVRIRHALGDSQSALVIDTGEFLSSRAGEYVYKLENNGRAVRKMVTLGRNNGRLVEVVDGLSKGDTVITSNYGAFKDYEWVEVR